MRFFLAVVISLFGCCFGSKAGTLRNQDIAKVATNKSVYISANFKNDNDVIRLTYFNNNLENIEIILTPQKKDYLVPCDSIILIKAYLDQKRYSKDILAYKGDSIEISDPAVHLLYSEKMTPNRWMTLNEFHDFYKMHYPLVPQKIDSVVDLLYTKVTVSGGYFLKGRTTVTIEQKKILYTSLYDVLHERI